MSDVKSENMSLSESKSKNNSSNFTETVVNNVDKKNKKEPIKKSISKIFVDAFSVQKDKDLKIKPAQITKTDLKSLCSIEKMDDFNSEIIEGICKDAQETDPALECLTEIILNIMESKNRECQKALFEICIKIASGVWIKKQDGSLDLYQDIFDNAKIQENTIEFMENSLHSIFEKRIAGIAKMQIVSHSQSDAEFENAKNREDSVTLNKGCLKKQQRNLFVIGILWLLEKNKVDSDTIVNYFLNQIDVESPKATLKEVGFYLANQYLLPDTRFVRVLSILDYKISTLTEDKSRLAKLIEQKESQIYQLQQELLSKNKLFDDAARKNLAYQASIEELKSQIENQNLDARANRTHLRDDVKNVRARAFNLLTEDVLVPLELSLSALKRDIPKIDVAIDKIELVIESINGELLCFKE